MKYILLFSILLTGCVNIPVVHPMVAGAGVAVADAHDFKVTQAKHDYLIRQGVPASFFVPRANDSVYPFNLSQENEGYAYDILQKDRNP